MPIKRFYLGLLILFSAPALNGRAQNALTFSSALSGDSVFYRPTPSQSWREITSVPVPLMLGGYLISPAKEEVQNLRHNFIAGGRVTRADDYLQYAPILLTLGLKIGGYRGRSGWGRMLTADAFSVALMASLVNGLKYGIREERPDGADNRSFPSGHTATAFMAATWLHKEYGQTRSIWFSVGGYATAVSVGVMRIVNNKHWINDVLFGAGLGIFSAELGYYLADLIFKEKGLRCGLKPWAQSEDGRDAAGFAALNLGVDVPLNSGGGETPIKRKLLPEWRVVIFSIPIGVWAANSMPPPADTPPAPTAISE